MPGQSPVFVTSFDWAMLPRWMKLAVALGLTYFVVQSVWGVLAVRELLELPKKEARAKAIHQEQMDALRGFGSNARTYSSEPPTPQELMDFTNGRSPTRGSTPAGSASGPYGR